MVRDYDPSMATLAIRQILQTIQSHSTTELALKASIFAGFVHHFTCQFPRQADVITTLSFWACGNVCFLTAAILAEHGSTLIGLIVGVIVFNAIYV